MSNLTKLAFVETLPNKSVDKKAQRRVRLVEHLKQQIELAENPALTFTREIRKKDEETGEVTVTTVERPVQSWVTVADGTAYVRCKVGVKMIEFAEGKRFIICKPEEVKGVLETLMSAASEGELDDHITALFAAK